MVFEGRIRIWIRGFSMVGSGFFSQRLDSDLGFGSESGFFQKVGSGSGFFLKGWIRICFFLLIGRIKSGYNTHPDPQPWLKVGTTMHKSTVCKDNVLKRP